MERSEGKLWSPGEVARLLALVENEKRYYQDILNAVPVPLAVVTPSLTVLSMNAAFRGIYSGAAGEPLAGPLASEQVRSLIAGALAGNEPHSGRLAAFADRGGENRSFQLTAIPFRDSADQAGREALLILESGPVAEASPAVSAESQTEKADAMARLAGRLAHDVNNLLTVITGNAEILLEDMPPGERRTALEHLLEAAQRTAAIGDALRRIGRPPQPKPELFDLNDFLKSKTVGVRLALSGRPEFISVDRAMLSEGLRTLATWAAERIPPGERLTLKTMREGESVTLTLGPVAGLSAEQAERWMEPFGARDGYELTAVYTALRAAGVTPSLEESDGGHRVWMRFPLAALAREEEVKTVLVVEDEDAVRQAILRLLSQSGYRVLEANSGVRALEMARGLDKVDLLLTDVSLGGLDGPEVARLMRGKFPGLKTIYISGRADDARLSEASLRPDETFLSKPFRLRALLDQIGKFLS